MSNRLAQETSPYLLQHAHNPVDWYPWGEEALRRAQAEDRPILLSVGYSACHWCHVMERESFEDAATAALMNDLFINIKVDREERPDIDALYMAAVQAMTRHGGWPMTVFLTPDGKPFYGGTYFPPEPRHGMPSFAQVLESVAAAYRERRSEVLASAENLRDHVDSLMRLQIPQVTLNTRLLSQAAQQQMAQFDARNGGFGGAPKFPQVMSLELLLRHWRRTGDKTALAQVEATLQAMARGGIYDHLGGGFARYSVDAAWLVPHFEKMLYDNALLARIYLEAYQATGDTFYRRIAEETLDYALRDMLSPEGGFYAAEDADSEGVEGKFYVWTPSEVQALLDHEDARLAQRYWDITPEGNFEGHSIANTPRDLEAVAAEFSMEPDALWERLKGLRATLLAARETRVRPGRDGKILAAWNGMMLRALALAAQALGSERYRIAAERTAAFLVEGMQRDGRLYRTFTAGQLKYHGYLEDYACVADGLLALYAATLEPRWLAEATRLAETITARFWDADERAFFDTADDHEQLVARPRDTYDNPTPSGNSVAVDVLLRLGHLLERPDMIQYAATVFDQQSGALAQLPHGFGRLLAALDFYLGTPREVAIIGDPRAEDTQALLRAAASIYAPNTVIAGGLPGPETAHIPLLEGREQLEGRATAYVCVRRACQLPTTAPSELVAQLSAEGGDGA